MSNVAIDLTKTVKEIITTMKTAIDNLNTNVDSLKSEILLAAHPVGSYYISDKATDPGTLFGGTWKKLDPGLTLISQGKGTDKFGSFEFVAGQTYGERMHQLTVDELPTVTPKLNFQTQSDNFTAPLSEVIKTNMLHKMYDNRYANPPISPFGGDKPHNNLQTSRAAYVWLRTA